MEIMKNFTLSLPAININGDYVRPRLKYLSLCFCRWRNDFGVSVFEIYDNGSLSHVTKTGDTPEVNLAQANGITIAKVGDTSYLFVAGSLDDGMSVFAIKDVK